MTASLRLYEEALLRRAFDVAKRARVRATSLDDGTAAFWRISRAASGSIGIEGER